MTVFNEKTNPVMNFECLQTIDCNQGAVRSVRFNVDGSYCLTCGSDRKIKLWNPHKAILLKTYGGHGDEVLDACSSCDNSHIISGGLDKSVILWDVTTGLPVRRLRGHASRITCIRFNEDSSVAISGSQDNTVMCWDVRSRKPEPIQTLKEAKDSITSLVVTDHEILSSSLDCRVRCYDIRSCELFTDFIGESVTCTNFTRDSHCMVISCSDSTIRLMDRDTGELLGEYKGHDTGDYTVESCVDNRDAHILSGSADGCIWCWDLVKGTIDDKLVHEPGCVVHSVCPHPSQPFLLSACRGNIKLWGIPGSLEDINV